MVCQASAWKNARRATATSGVRGRINDIRIRARTNNIYTLIYIFFSEHFTRTNGRTSRVIMISRTSRVQQTSPPSINNNRGR